MPCWSGAERGERAGQSPEQIGFRATSSEGEAHATCRLDDSGRDLDQPEPQCRELRLRQIAGLWNGVAHCQHQPVGGCVQHEAHLIGDGGMAGRAIQRQLRLVQFDQVLGLSARAIQTIVDPLGRAVSEIGDDEADVEAERRRLDAGDGAPLAVP